MGKGLMTWWNLILCFAAQKRKSLTLITNLRYGLVVRIAGSHPAGPGSIPGNGILLKTFLNDYEIINFLHVVVNQVKS